MIKDTILLCAHDILCELGFPSSILDAWASEGVVELLPIQRLAIEKKVLDAKSSLIVGPTSSGKTFVGELVCTKHALGMKPCLFLVPFKALAEEKFAEFQQKYGHAGVGATVAVSTADRREFDRSISKGEFDVAVLTYEKLACLLVTHPGIVRNAGAMVVDEIQMVRDETRGAGLELLLTRVRQVAPTVQIVGLSAVVSELNGFDEWLGAVLIKDDHRPVPLREGVLGPNGRFRYIEWAGVARTEGEEQLPRMVGDDELELAASLVVSLLKNEGEQVLVFVASRDNTQKLAGKIADEAEFLGPARAVEMSLAALEGSETVEALNRTINRAVAFHNADLTIDERMAVERGFRNGEIRCVVATSTLSMGVNMPASTVVIAEHEKWSRDAAGQWQRVPLSVAEYRNMSGRAGRFGMHKDQFGRSIVVTSRVIQQEAVFSTYVKGAPEPLESAILKQDLDQLFLQTLASGLCDTESGLHRFFLRTFGARQAWSTDEARLELRDRIESAVGRFQLERLVEVDQKAKIEVTAIGLICAASGMSIETFSKVAELVDSDNTSATDVAYVASRCTDTGPLAVALRRLSAAQYQQETPRFLQAIRDGMVNSGDHAPITSAVLETFGALPPYDDALLLKYQAIALAWIEGVATRDIERGLPTNAGRIRSIGSYCAWVAETAAKIAWSLGKAEAAKAYEVTADRFQYGCTKDALLLAQVPHKLHRAERERIVAAGFRSLQKIVETPSDKIAKEAKVSPKRVAELQKGIVAVIGEQLELERQQVARLTALARPVAPVEMLYTMKGTMLEQAIDDLLKPPFCPLRCSRICSQREGEADLKIVLSSSGNAIAQVNARESATATVGIKKAGDILQQSPELNPQAFICFGRPDFHEDARKKAKQHAANGINYKAIPLYVLAEMYVRFEEGKITSDRVAEILEKETGYLTIDRI